MSKVGEEYLQQVIEYILQSKAVLFLGAGASCAAGGPNGNELASSIKSNFPKADQSLNDFIEVCQDVIETPSYNRIDLEEFIKDKLYTLQPSEAHRSLTKYDWTCIFTTNFDDLVEVAYRTTPQPKKLIPIYSDKFGGNLFDKSKIHLFKIMGSITAPECESGQMVLTRSDYNMAIVKRRKYLESLSDFVKNGTLIFIGYSFNDHIVLDIMDDLINIHGLDRLPWSYALFSEVRMDDKNKHKLALRKILPLEYSFEDFFEYLDYNYKSPTKVSKPENVKLKIRDQIITINIDTYKQYAEYFEILDEKKMAEVVGNKDDFFKGINRSWAAFKEDWDFKRDIYISSNFQRTIAGNTFKGCINDRIFNELAETNIESNKILLITGMAGVGKTTVLRRIAYDVYMKGYGPVIFIKTDKISIDYKMLTSFIEHLKNEVNAKALDGKHSRPLKPVIIFDDAASHIRHLNGLKDYLTSRSKPALIIAAERKGEWGLMFDTFPFRLPDENIYEINEQLSMQEKIRIVDHFYDLGYLPHKGDAWTDEIEKQFQNSLFATIYTWIHPAKKPLDEIIRDQYLKLTENTQQAYKFICALHQFNLPMNIELLVRSMKCSYTDLYDQIINRDANKVIFEEQDEFDNLLYRTHHRIIARKTVEFFFSDPEEQKDIFLTLLKSTILSNRKEREIIEKLLIDFIGPNSKSKILSHDQQRQLFEVICERSPTRSLAHHWGILEMEDENYTEAENKLKWALELPKDDMESYRGESDQNILTSLGNLYSRLGMQLAQKNENSSSERYYEKAENCFKNSKHGEFPNGHAYHAHANMLHKRGNLIEDETLKLKYYAKALEIISIAKDNLNEDSLQRIIELETKILMQIQDKDKIERNIRILSDEYNSASGYCLYAQIICNKTKNLPKSEKKLVFETALLKIEEGLKEYPLDEYCLNFKSKLIKELYPNDLPKFYKSLLEWKAAANTPNIWLLFELGRVAFILGYFEKSQDFFKELETGIGVGHKMRFRARYPIIDEHGKRKEFEGKVIKVYSIDEGEIHSDTLRSLRYPIPFSPIVCTFNPYPGDRVKFYISFTYRGPRAENVKKLV